MAPPANRASQPTHLHAHHQNNNQAPVPAFHPVHLPAASSPPKFPSFGKGALPPPIHPKVRELASQLDWVPGSTTNHSESVEKKSKKENSKANEKKSEKAAVSEAAAAAAAFAAAIAAKGGDLDSDPAGWMADVVRRAQEGDARAQALYAVCLQTGSLTQRNEPEALRWLSLAASRSGGPTPPAPPDREPKENTPTLFGTAGTQENGPVFTFGSSTTPVSSPTKSPAKPSTSADVSSAASSPAKPAPLDGILSSSTYAQESGKQPQDRYLAIICHLLGEWYRRGVGAAPNLNTAFRYLKRAANLGHAEGLNSLAGMHERGEGVIRDDAAAFAMYMRSAEAGNILAQFKVGQAYEKGKGKRRCGAQNTQAQTQSPMSQPLTLSSQTKTGTQLNYARAKSWYRKAAAKGYFPASVRLAILSLDPAYETLDNLVAAATRINTPRSLHDLAIAYSSTRHGATPDAQQMRTWLRRAAQAGHVRSQWLLGKLYQDGTASAGVNLQRAFYWFHRAALQGFQPAQWAVSGMYRSGQGVERDSSLADKWHRAANRCGCQRLRPDIQDYACVSVYSLNEANGPVWNSLDQEKPFNLVSAANSSIDAKVLGASAPGAPDAVTGLPVRLDVGNTQSSAGVGTSSPSKAVTGEGGAGSPIKAASSGHGLDGYSDTYEVYDAEHDGYRDMRALLDSMYLPKGVYLQERSNQFPTLMQIERYRETHPDTISRLCEVKRTFMHAENLCKAEKHDAAVRELARGFKAFEGLFDLGNYNLRLLAEISVQTVLARTPNDVDALLVDCFVNMLARPAELSIIALDAVIGTKTDESAAYLLRGGCKARLGRFTEALEDYDLAVKYDDPRAATPEIYYQRGACHSNIDGGGHCRKVIDDLGRYLSMVPLDGRRVPDAHYTIAGSLLALDNGKKMIDHFWHGLHAEGIRLPFYPTIINSDLKTRLTLEVKYTLYMGGEQVRRQPWSKVPAKIMRNVEGDEPQSVAKECLACGSVGKTRTCAGCRGARYCSTNCQIAHWIRGHSTVCRRMDRSANAA
ncbi:hypothetical protein HK104_010368 [Borealophlyctis nickersoniae]|nr:hypothetical protein HK104_010368 [Borealophlyctis nickersoniae]